MENAQIEMGSTRNAITNIPHEPKHSRVRKALIVLTVLLFILASVFIGLYIHSTQQNRQRNVENPTRPLAKSTTYPPGPTQGPTVAATEHTGFCTKMGCITAASSRLKSEIRIRLDRGWGG